VLPDFATWRTTRGSQGFDARTFEVRAKPVQVIDGARPGMSVIVEGWSVRACWPPACAANGAGSGQSLGLGHGQLGAHAGPWR
jgi:hypothetical protein